SAMSIDPNVNFAILPNSENAQESARTLHGRGFELLCHLPMEPLGYPKQQPGANAILTSMSDEQIADTTRANVGAIPNIRGVNNHMGSAATSDRRVMTTVLGALPKGLYFIDSRTAGSSIAGQVAHEMDIRTASRNVFLDDVQSEHAVRRQLEHLAEAASTRGVAIGIGHMYPVTMKVLGEEAPRLRAEGFRFIRASEAVR
ncbi:MAG TPA: divergent polysaccharide deacetylase family protein, partial [Thermoanaerobaculia bacterium]|nr:divergent polysaccharide deacetylase family protein [Thermoanaerobaculia bacterium]